MRYTRHREISMSKRATVVWAIFGFVLAPAVARAGDEPAVQGEEQALPYLRALHTQVPPSVGRQLPGHGRSPVAQGPSHQRPFAGGRSRHRDFLRGQAARRPGCQNPRDRPSSILPPWTWSRHLPRSRSHRIASCRTMARSTCCGPLPVTTAAARVKPRPPRPSLWPTR